jgi:MoxR-like ATPase
MQDNQEKSNEEITLSQTVELFNSLFGELSKVIVGQQKTLGELIIGFLAGGHLLMEGVPGVAKTLMVRTLASVAKADFKRVQFTPDLMPGDLTGINIFNPAQGKFELRRGPIFTDILLADEINRTPPKTQSALLEAMQERQVTIDGESYLLGDLFTVVATQNPIEYEGTYPLPEAELDRFLMKLIIDYPLPNEERDIILRFHEHGDFFNIEQFNLKAIADETVVKAAREEIRKIRVEKSIADYIVKIITATRNHPFVALGSSPRAGISFIAVAKTSAAIHKRNFVMPDDIKEFARPVLRHRLILKPEAEIEGISPDDIIDEILEQVTVPR